MHTALKVYKEEVFEFINRDFRIENLVDDCLFTEGPVWNPGGYYLFSDITANHIYKINAREYKQLVISQSGTHNMLDPDLKPEQVGSNGLAYTNNGDLLVCQHGSHAVALYDGKELRPFISSYRGKPFNSPNDIIVHKNGTVYFSDPPYGLKDGKLNPAKFQQSAGVYVYKDEKISLLCDKYQYPNGVCLSNDQETLYISSNKPFERFISMYDTATHQLKGVFAEENSDGMKMDRYGNLYLYNNEGVIILDKNGERMAMIELTSIPANACWGGKEGNDLFITARENVFLIRDILNGR